MSLKMYVQGDGETLVMLHGWGMHSGIWHELAASLAAHFKVVCIDLPGHGYSSMECPLELNALGEQILAQVPDACHWLGWSLGGSVLMNLAALAPERIKSMALIAANPRFVRDTDWLHGVDAGLLLQFARDLEQDLRKTLKRFIALQTLHSQAPGAMLKQLREQLFEAGNPDAIALRQGLDILLHSDLREAMERLCRPCMILLGERDQLVPATVADYYNDLPCRPQVVTIAGAGHAPFLSHPEPVATALTDYFSEQEGIACE